MLTILLILVLVTLAWPLLKLAILCVKMVFWLFEEKAETPPKASKESWQRLADIACPKKKDEE